MDLIDSEIKIHPQAAELLFSHFRTIAKLFMDVIGQFEVDYMTIGVLTRKNELLFFSSSPSKDWCSIEKGIWPFKMQTNQDFFLEERMQLWVMNEWPNETYLSHFSIGLSIPSTFEGYRVLYSFATRSNHEMVKNRIINNTDSLIRMGRFCLKNIFREIPLPIPQNAAQQKPRLTLIVNNKECYENNTRKK